MKNDKRGDITMAHKQQLTTEPDRKGAWAWGRVRLFSMRQGFPYRPGPA